MRRILLSIFLGSITLWADAQALMGTTGLLHAPTADMQRDKTFLCGGNYLNTHPLSTHFHSREVGYTFNYYINITMLPWLEVSYICTLVHADHGSTYFPEQSWGKFTNQDRIFSVRLRLWKEGWWKEWTPQIVLGLDDPTSHADHGGGELVSGNTSGSNNYATRYYLAVTKHVDFANVGELGIHSSFVYGNAKGIEHYRRPAFGANFRFRLPDKQAFIKAVNNLNLMAEYDARTVNVGAHYQLWKDHINLIAELNDGRYFSGGIYFKVHLK
ncbi:YjbH domain-containing protein [Phocaeicola sp.]|uniref:YjbH domain-containing protein n=1 Tax=Phocaeicola sp. TaxID=2773926 RepID=UPI0023BC1552|nr:YjbH domain-containing protein [Phocaeicola sp.]MDE5676314.1 YjbH domain-containing protein [Phocaeicola sp.]